jgi:hypothetical protein
LIVPVLSNGTNEDGGIAVAAPIAVPRSSDSLHEDVEGGKQIGRFGKDGLDILVPIATGHALEWRNALDTPVVSDNASIKLRNTVVGPAWGGNS